MQGQRDEVGPGSATQVFGTLPDEAGPGAETSVDAALLEALRPVRHWPASGAAGHIPWISAVVALTRPRRLVQLGAHDGADFFAACQAVRELGTGTACIAVDRWAGDASAGPHDESAFTAFRTTAQERYAGTASWIREDPDTARASFAPGSVDLLHLDGSRGDDAVRHDLATWRSALGDRGVVLLHGADAGAGTAWREIEHELPGRTLLFGQQHGIGLLSLGARPESPLDRLLRECDDPARAAVVQQFFTALADLTTTYRTSIVDARERTDREAGATVRRLEAALAAARLEHADRLEHALTSERSARRAEVEAVRQEFHRSLSWRLSRPLRAPAALRRRLHARRAPVAAAPAQPPAPPVGAELFDAAWYARWSGTTHASPQAAFDDYRARGAHLGLAPHPLFDPAWYGAQVPGVPAGRLLEHYLTEGARAGLSPHPAFAGAAEAARSAPQDTPALVHYLRTPAAWRTATCDVFDGGHYLDLYPDVEEAGLNPLLHYLEHGERENRSPSPRFDPVRYRTRAAGLADDANALVHYLRAQGTVPTDTVLRLPEEPRVTVVVPVHGKWAYTARCLHALSRTTGSVPFEVVVVDDASPDDTAERLDGVTGVRVVRHTTNTGYVGACNSGIAAARGELVVLLNNDTRVEPGWLDPLVEAMDDPRVGLVGSRLVYPDGRLQEAGGILFSDGSGWNYGKFGDPEGHAFTYRRDVDYCSGASIMLRRATLEALGGLDERFAPAYYDDADLAFGVRGLGLRVVYEPRSVVLHDEGVSHGTDETQGVKAYQVVNREKFVAKWADELAAHLPPGAENVERAARRRQGSDLVVVVDHYVPRTDQDAGSARMTAVLAELRRLGHGVLLVPQNGMRGEGPYADALEALGVEVVAGRPDLRELLTSLRGVVGTVVLSRVTVAWAYLATVRAALPDAHVVFDTVDLHFLREERESALAGLPPTAATRATRELELALVRSCDSTLVVAPYERDLLRQLVPDADVRVLPTVHPRVEGPVLSEQRDGLVFVGSFAHVPNVDGLRWFTTEVLPLLRRTHPGAGVTVVGRDPAPDLVAQAPEGVEFLGWVEDLAPVYATARVAIAPLRFGAGVKGKIGEAMTYGVPVVMTPVGAEGMDVVDGRTGLVAGTAAEFADALARLLDDDDLWTAVSREARAHVEAELGSGAFTARLADVVREGTDRVVAASVPAPR